jgi:hypothetical protein
MFAFIPLKSFLREGELYKTHLRAGDSGDYAGSLRQTTCWGIDHATPEAIMGTARRSLLLSSFHQPTSLLTSLAQIEPPDAHRIRCGSVKSWFVSSCLVGVL